MEQEQTKTPVEQTEDTSSDSAKNVVAYETYQKLLGEKKNTQSKLQEYEQELRALREEKLKSEGKVQELNETYRSERDKYKTELEKTKQQYAWNALTNTIKSHASKHNCKDPEGFIRLMDDEDLKRIEVGEDFSINTDSLEQVINDYKNKKSYLFDSSKKSVANGNPTTKIQENKNDFSKLSNKEIEELYKKHYK